jgi:hypothetical protein
VFQAHLATERKFNPFVMGFTNRAAGTGMGPEANEII